MSIKRELFRFGTPRQETGEKHITHGDLIEARNVRMVKAGVYSKRRGLARTATTFAGGTLSGTPACVVDSDYGGAIMRDTGNQMWELNSAANEWEYRGTVSRTWAETRALLSLAYTQPKPFSCLVGATIWLFAIGTNSYDLTIASLATGEQTYQRIQVTATAIAAADAVYDGTNVWVFWVDNATNGRVYAHKFTVATPTVAPTATTYYTMPAAPVDVSAVKLQCVKARYFSAAAGGGKVFVCAAGGNSVAGPTYKRAAMHSILDPATGLAVAAGGQAAATSIAYNGASGGYQLGGLSIHAGQDGSASTWYYTVAGVTTAPYTNTNVRQIEVTASTFATFTARLIDDSGAFTTPPSLIAVASLCQSTYQLIRFTTYSSGGGLGAASTGGYGTSICHVSSGTVTSRTYPSPAPYPDVLLWVASGFAQIGSTWYTIGGLDDYGLDHGLFGTESFTQQRTFYILKVTIGANANACSVDIVGQAAVGNAPALWHRNTALITYSGTELPIVAVPQLLAYGTKAYAATGISSHAMGYVDVGFDEIDTEKVYGNECLTGDGRITIPGSIPTVVGNGSSVHEISPLNPPMHIVCSGGGGAASFNVVTLCYVITDADGTVFRSAPKVLTGTFNGGATLRGYVTPIRLPGTQIEIEFYAGATSPKLQYVYRVPQTPGAFTGYFVDYVLPATAAGLIDGETLYSWGGAISQAQPLSCRAVESWKGRTLLANRQSVYASSERAAGVGPYFSGSQVTFCADTGGDITSLRGINSSYCAVFSETAVGALSGAGPDQRGNGNFEFQFVSSKAGLGFGGVPLRAEAGVFFQSLATGRIMVLTPSLEVRDAGGGAWNYSTYVITSAAWCEEDRLLVFSARDSSAMIALDYQHPTEAAPFGSVYLWTTAAGQKVYGCDVDKDGMLIVGASGETLRFAEQWVDDRSGGTDTYRMKLATAELQPAGLQGEFTVSWIQVLVSVYAASSATLTIYPAHASRTLADSRVTSKTKALTCTNAGDPTSFAHRPAHCARIPAVGLAVEEAAGITTQSFAFEGFAIEYATHGRLRLPDSGGVI